MSIEPTIEVMAIDEEKGIEINYTTFPELPFISFVEYSDKYITFSKQLTDLMFHYNLDLSGELPVEEIVDSMLDLAKKFKSIYNKGLKNDEPSTATMFCDKRDKTKQFYKLINNGGFSDKAMYDYSKDIYSSIEDSYGYDLIVMGMKHYFSKDISIKEELEKALEGHLEGRFLTIYRGINEKNRVDGLSYTLSTDVAKFFAKRWTKKGYVNKYRVNIDDVIAFIDNGEKEIITDKAILIEEEYIVI